MKKLLFILLLYSIQSFGQNIKLEIADYHRKIDNKVYATYQFVNSSYSHSRPTILFITNKITLFDLSSKFKDMQRPKQEYTDFWFLGIENFDPKNITEADKKIIDNFFQSVIKYRADYDLPEYDLERLNSNMIFIEKSNEVCKYLICSTQK